MLPGLPCFSNRQILFLGFVPNGLGSSGFPVGEPLGIRVAINQFDDRHWRHVAIPVACSENAHIATVAITVSGAPTH